MQLSISNIAWSVGDDEQVAKLLRRYEIGLIDVAPGKYFPDLELVEDEDLVKVRSGWRDRGIALKGMQSLLFGQKSLHLFGNAEVQDAMLNYLNWVCKIAAGLGIDRLVFGSPKNRDRGALSLKTAEAVAVTFFRRLAMVAEGWQVTVCLEPNPERYDCNFMTTTDGAARIVRAVNHPAVRLQFDTGTLTVNGEDPDEILQRHQDIIGHVHISEPDLKILGTGGTDHAKMARALWQVMPEAVVSIEMLPSGRSLYLADIESAIQIAARFYQVNHG